MHLEEQAPTRGEIIDALHTHQEVATDRTSSAARKYHIWTIGCQMNVADSNHVAAELEKIGYGPTDRLDDADVVVLNTCVVRQSAEDKAIGKLGSLKPWRKADPDRTLALMGCMVGVKPSRQLLDAYPEVDVFMPPSESTPLINHLREVEINAEMAAIEREQLIRRYQVQDELQPIGTRQSIRHLALSGQAPVAAHVPVVYGCSHACTFCIIPFRRGVERSRPVAEIVDEIRSLVDQGVREVTLLGQIVDRYGYDWRGDLGNSATVDAFTGHVDGQGGDQDYDLADLLAAVNDIDGLWRIRFLTSHPNYMTGRILHAVRDLPKVCEHIEVPIQAGDDTVLEQMHRGYTSAGYRALVERIRTTIPNVAIHTDIIVGFCGENAEQFERTYEVLADLKLDKAHLARYSPRPGTVSARRMADDVPEAEKVRRHKLLEDLQEAICAEINSRSLGQTVEILVEDLHKGKWRGRTRQNKLVFIESDLPLRGRLVEAEITWTGPWSMQGRLVRDVSPLPDRLDAPKPVIRLVA
ncbi:MAG: MiaB/RimO family radical SAM methylthiotransferase [Caldilineaceae bacterium]|nr:MiaB/RimO family radical SAM methylthiotransferase [Caldilineaceae bacterium]